MAHSYIIDLGDSDATDSALTGGKAAALATLTQAGLPVPAAFCLTTLLTSSTDASALPAGTLNALRLRWEDLEAPHGVAVRSSATTEDGVSASAAGQHHTELGVRTFSELVEAITRCQQSLWAAPAVAYRRHRHIDDEQARMAVLVQAMIQPTWAGVMFTAAGPTLTTEDEPISIEAVPGLGHTLVDGATTPDQIELRRRRPHDILYHSAAPTAHDSRTRHRLDVKTLGVLADLGLRIEQLLDAPQDVEWAVDDTGCVHILQARPITAELPARATKASWCSPVRGASWARMSICDSWLSEPLSPLFATTLFPRLVDVWAANWGGPSRKRASNPIIPHPMHGTINGFAYLRFDFPLSSHPRRALELVCRWLAFHVSPVERRWRDRVLPLLSDRLAQLADEDMRALSSLALNERIRSVQESSADYWAIIGGLAWHWNASEWAATKALGRKERASLATLLSGARQAYYAEAELKAIADSDPAVQDHLLRTYLRRFGHLVHNLDLVEPTPCEDPSALRHAIDAHRRGAIRARGPSAAIDEGRPRLPRSPLRRAAIRLILPWARHWAEVRDDALHHFTLGWPYMRAAYLELGRRLTAEQLINAPGDVFYLYADELDAWLDSDVLIDSAAWKDHVAERRAERRRRSALIPPDVVPVDASIRLLGADITPLALFGLGAAGRDDHTLHGSPVSPGTHTGPARVVRTIEQASALQPGEILVVRQLSPAWAPLLTIAGGLVADVGGALSHGSVVAREYGVPAIMGAKEATDTISTGQMITVNGDTGTVSLRTDEASVRG